MAADDKLAEKYSPEVLALWGEDDEAATKKWVDDKKADFEAGGKMKEKYETMEKLQEWMDGKVYGVGGTKDKTLAIRGNPRCFFDIAVGGEAVGRVVMQLRKDVVPKTAEVRAPAWVWWGGHRARAGHATPLGVLGPRHTRDFGPEVVPGCCV